MTVSLVRSSPSPLGSSAIDGARALSAIFAASADRLDSSAEFPHENIRLLQQAGLVALTAPVELGGRGAGLSEAADIIRLIARR